MDLSNIKVFRVNQLLVFIISNPLTVDEVFMAFFKSKLAKFVSKNLELPIISVQIFEDLNKAGTSIQSVLNNDEILISNFNILLILIIITTITIVMLVVSVYKKYRKIKDIKAEATQQELLPMGSNKTNAINVTPFEINETAV